MVSTASSGAPSSTTWNRLGAGTSSSGRAAARASDGLEVAAGPVHGVGPGVALVRHVPVQDPERLRLAGRARSSRPPATGATCSNRARSVRNRPISRSGFTPWSSRRKIFSTSRSPNTTEELLCSACSGRGSGISDGRAGEAAEGLGRIRLEPQAVRAEPRRRRMASSSAAGSSSSTSASWRARSPSRVRSRATIERALHSSSSFGARRSRTRAAGRTSRDRPRRTRPDDRDDAGELGVRRPTGIVSAISTDLIRARLGPEPARLAQEAGERVLERRAVPLGEHVCQGPATSIAGGRRATPVSSSAVCGSSENQ